MPYVSVCNKHGCAYHPLRIPYTKRNNTPRNEGAYLMSRKKKEVVSRDAAAGQERALHELAREQQHMYA